MAAIDEAANVPVEPIWVTGLLVGRSQPCSEHQVCVPPCGMPAPYFLLPPLVVEPRLVAVIQFVDL